MDRRHFLLSLAALGVTRAAQRAPVKITRIALATIEGRFHKFVAMNSQAARPGGHTYNNVLVRIGTDQGVEGIGVMSYSAPDDAHLRALKTLIGANPLDLYERKA